MVTATTAAAAATASAADSCPAVTPTMACSGSPPSWVNVHGQATHQHRQRWPWGASPARRHGRNAVIRVGSGGAAALERPRYTSQHVTHARGSSSVGGSSVGVIRRGVRAADRTAHAARRTRYRVG